MNKIKAFFFLIIFNLSFSQIEDDKYYAKQETVKINSQVFKKEREIEIFYPDEYFREPERKFKVVYLFDSQNLRIFNFVNGTIQYVSMNEVEPLIVVGICTEDRWFEFLTKNNHAETLKEYEPPIGGADILIQHIELEIEPYIKQNLRTQDYRIAIGHSLGATFAMYASIKSDKLFDYSILISPNFYYDKEQNVDLIKNYLDSNSSKIRKYYLCNGFGDMYEKKFNPALKKVIKLLRKNKNKNIVFKYEKLNINSHGKTLLEGVYKGLLNLKNNFSI